MTFSKPRFLVGGLVVLGAGVAAYLSISQLKSVDQASQTAETDRLVLGQKSTALENGSVGKLYFIGVESKSGITTDDLQRAGIEIVHGRNKTFTGRFLIETVEERSGESQLKRIYAYELGPGQNGLPGVLLDYENIIKKTRIREGINRVAPMVAARTVPVAGVSGLAVPLAQKFQNDFNRRDQVVMLQFMIENSMPFDADLAEGDLVSLPQLTNLSTFLGEKTLRQVSAALFFEGSSNKALLSAFTDEASLMASYETFRHERRDRVLQQIGQMTARANFNDGLKVYPLGSDFAVLALDCNVSLSKAAATGSFFGQKLDIRKGDVERLRNNLRELCSAGLMLPLGLFSLSNGHDFFQIIDFTNVEKFRDQQLLRGLVETAASVASSYVTAGVAISWAGRFFKHFIGKNGSKIYYKDRWKIYPQYRAAVESGVLNLTQFPMDMQMNELLVALLKENLRAVNSIDPAETQALTQALESKDIQLQIDAFYKSTVLISAHAEGVKLVAGGDKKLNDFRKNAIASTATFVTAQASQQYQKNYVADLTSRAGEGSSLQQRKPPTTNAVAAPFEFQTKTCAATKPSLILFKGDGLVLDQLKVAANKGWANTIKSLFLSRGVEFSNAFTRNAVSTSSWIEAESGLRSSETGVIGSGTITHDPTGPVDSYLTVTHDFRKSIGVIGNPEGTRTYRVLQKTGVKILDNYLGDESYDAWNVLVHSGKNLPVVGMGKAIARESIRFVLTDAMTDSLDEVATFDAGVGEEVAGAIKSGGGKYRLVQVWFGGADHVGHGYLNGAKASFEAIDGLVRRILEAAKEDPSLCNAHIMMISDHGMDGGFVRGGGDWDFLGLNEAYQLNNTEFNLHLFFAGMITQTSGKYFERVITHKIDERALRGDKLLNFMHGFIKGKFDYTKGFDSMIGLSPYHIFAGDKARKVKNAALTAKPKLKDEHHEATISVDPYGDSAAHVSFLGDANAHQRKLYYEITHFNPGQPYTQSRNVFDDLFTASLSNLDPSLQGQGSQARDKRVTNAIRSKYNNRPIGYIGMTLDGIDSKEPARVTAVNKFVNHILGSIGVSEQPTRNPILILAQDPHTNAKKAGLLLVSDKTGNPHILYVPLKSFDQDASGVYSGEVDRSGQFDPLGYISGATRQPLLAMNQYHSEDQILNQLVKAVASERNSTVKGKETALPYFVGVLTVSPKMKTNTYYHEARARTPDLVVIANSGFSFNNSQNHIGDHGSPYSARITWLVGDCRNGGTPSVISAPVFNTAVAPTVLDYLGKDIPPGLASPSLRNIIDGACQQR